MTIQFDPNNPNYKPPIPGQPPPMPFMPNTGQPQMPGVVGPAIPPGAQGPPPPDMGAGGAPPQFGPTNNLIGNQFSPDPSQRLGGVQGNVDQAAQGVAGTPTQGFQGIGNTQNFDFGAANQNATGMAQQQLQQVGQGRGRQDIALDMLRNFDEEQGDQQRLGTQAIGRDAARLGRLGSGQVTTSLGDLSERQGVQRNRFMRDLLGDTAGAEIGDRRADLESLLGASSQFGAQDLGRAGFEQGLRGEARGERGAERQAGLEDFSQRRAQLQDMSDLERQLYGQEQGGREELRGERGYQRGLAREDVDSRRQQLAMQDQLAGNAFQRRQQLAQMLSGAGFGGGEQNLAGLLGQAMQGNQGGGEWDWLQSAASMIPGLI